MSKNSGTRSGLLWEVERLLDECRILADTDSRYGMPQLLLMENVPQVHSKRNAEDWSKWLNALSDLGYINKWQDLNAKDHGIPQNRNRTFMLSWLPELGETYTFPAPFPLELRLKDMLEDEVDEKFYLSDEAVEGMIAQTENFPTPLP